MKMFVLLLLIMPAFLFAQGKEDCNKLHEGTFYFYPTNSDQEYIITRNGNTAIDKVFETNDSSIWSMRWIDACTYELTFKSSVSVVPADTRQFLKDHKMVYKIISTDNDGYTFETYIDNTKSYPLKTERAWNKRQPAGKQQVLFVPVANEVALKKARFSDTSKYAILYLYRPKKIGQMLVTYPVYSQDNMIFAAANNSMAIYKVYREGPTEINAVFEINKSKAVVDFKFGQKFYVKCDIHIGLYAKPDLRIIEPEKALDEINKIGN